MGASIFGAKHWNTPKPKKPVPVAPLRTGSAATKGRRGVPLIFRALFQAEPLHTSRKWKRKKTAAPNAKAPLKEEHDEPSKTSPLTRLLRYL